MPINSSQLSLHPRLISKSILLVAASTFCCIPVAFLFSAITVLLPSCSYKKVNQKIVIKFTLDSSFSDRPNFKEKPRKNNFNMAETYSSISSIDTFHVDFVYKLHCRCLIWIVGSTNHRNLENSSIKRSLKKSWQKVGFTPWGPIIVPFHVLRVMSLPKNLVRFNFA